MKTYKYKIVSLLLLLAVSVQAQKFDKKITKKFKVNSDVTIEINAAHTDIDIETWNRNEVSIEAVIEVEGVSKKEAEKIFKNWNFEALANKNKIEINSLSDNSFFEFDGDFDFPDIEVHEIDIPDLSGLSGLSALSGLSGLSGLSVLAEFPEMPDFSDFSEIMEIMEMPEMDFEVEFDYDAYKKDSTYLKGYKMRIAKQVKKFKNSDWKKKLDSVRNSGEYKKNMEELKKATTKITIEMKELRNSEEFKHNMEEAKRISEEVKKEMLENKSEFKIQIQEAKEASKMAMELIKKMKEEEGKRDSLHNFSENVYFGYKTDKNSKVKIKKYLKIKVPKKATFDLNVRHGKVTIPESNKKMSANMSYGNFIGGVIAGSSNELIFSNSPVEIAILNTSNITLKNVPNAKFGTFNNSNLFSNSSDVYIEEVGANVALSQKFGNLEIANIATDFEVFNLILDYSKATVNLSNANYIFQINSKKSIINLNKELTKSSTKSNDGVQISEGYHVDKSALNKLFLTGVYSTIILD